MVGSLVGAYNKKVELREKIEIERHVTIEHGRVLNNEFKMYPPRETGQGQGQGQGPRRSEAALKSLHCKSQEAPFRSCSLFRT